MTDRTSRETVIQAIDDFNSIKEAIEGHKINVPYATKTSEYAKLIAKIIVGSVSGTASFHIKVFNTKSLTGSVMQEMKGSKCNLIMGQAVSLETDDKPVGTK